MRLPNFRLSNLLLTSLLPNSSPLSPRLLLCGSLSLLLWATPFFAPRALAESDRRFVQTLCVEFVNEYVLPPQDFEGTTVGGLSAITYDRKTGKFYALSDEHGNADAHFYQLDIDLDDTGIQGATVEAVTYLTDETGQRYGGAFDPEGMALTPQGSLYVSSEGNPGTLLPPGLTEFDLQSGQQIRTLPIPERFIPAFGEPDADSDATVNVITGDTVTGDAVTGDAVTGNAVTGSETQDSSQQTRGIQGNLGFESLTLGATGTVPGEPLHLFTATEGPLVQDKTAGSINGTPRNRFLHYYLGEGRPLLLGEYVYELDPAPAALVHGLSEMLALDGNGHFLALERSFAPIRFQVKLFQFTLAGASDVSNRLGLRGNMRGVETIQKQLVMNLSELSQGEPGVTLDNLEGMTWGPQLADGSRSLILISDDNFKSFEKTQLLLFKVKLSQG